MTRQLPALVVLLLAATGLLVVVTVDPRVGLVLVGVSLLLAAGLRLTLPPRRAGWLVVRGRGLDACLLLGLGFAVVLLANTIPDI
ncbi:MAG: hypothetical protein JWN88_638 [Frankiales bacterium]|jgi:hypothetical protein|nr:hypothetical protein [Frankiales bacterium]